MPSSVEAEGPVTAAFWAGWLMDAFCPELMVRAPELAEAPVLFRSFRALNGDFNLLNTNIPVRDVKVVFGHWPDPACCPKASSTAKRLNHIPAW